MTFSMIFFLLASSSYCDKPRFSLTKISFFEIYNELIVDDMLRWNCWYVDKNKLRF